MVLKQSVIDAFATLGLSPNADSKDAVKAYKKLALEHHPDRNQNNTAEATVRFQEISAAWDICTYHYDDPRWSQAPEPGQPDEYDDDLDEDEKFEFYQYLFRQMFMYDFGGMPGFNRSSRNGFRSQRQSGYGASYNSYYYARPYERNPTNYYSESQSDRSNSYESSNEKRQRREKELCEERIRQFEAECAAQEREEAKAEREKVLKAEQRASAQAEAFALARAGDSIGVQKVVLKHALDMNGPERVAKQPKKASSMNFNTLLHAAASKCDEELIDFLIDKGSDVAALNKDGLSPFHQAIIAGNTPVVRNLLARRGKSSEGCHPSKAVADGRTPLQMAIASGSVSTVELLLKDATVHDVERCWEDPRLSIALKEVLETKKGFVPRTANSTGAPMSRKAALKVEAARKLGAEQEEKERKIADERARAAENLRRKEERSAKRAKEERIKEAARLKLEEEQREKAETVKLLAEEEARQRAKEARLIAEEARLKAESEACKKTEKAALTAEMEAERRRAEEERQRVQYEARLRAEAEIREKAEVQARRKAEMDAQRRAYQEDRRKVLEMEARQRVEAETRQREMERNVECLRQAEHRKDAEIQMEVERQRQIEARRQEVEARCREADERQRARAKAQAAKAERETQHKQDRTALKKATTPPPVDAAAAKRAETLRRLEAQAEEHKRLKLQQQAMSVSSSVSATDSKVEAIMRRRAEQSTRDKARNQRMKEEAERRAEPGADSFVVRPDAVKKRKSRVKKAEGNPGTPPHRQASYPLTPVSMSPSPLLWLTEPLNQKATPMTPPMTPEDLQTCVIPEDLFAYVPPMPRATSSPLPSPVVQEGRRGAPHKGQGWRGRGEYVTRHDGSKPGASQELAQKNAEIGRLSAELALLRG